jgi:choline monooxygenase
VYLALFPTTMVNVYPWGVSLNLVQPLGPARTRIAYHRWVARPELLEHGAGAGLDTVEAEDDMIVEAVQRGVRSRFARPAALSPQWELGVAHLHEGLHRLGFPAREPRPEGAANRVLPTPGE